MAVGMSFVALLVLIVLLGGLAIPVAAMFHAGIGCAREDTHRVTPGDPWVFFRRGARGKVRRIVVALLVLLALGVLLAWPQHPRHGNWLQSIHVASLPLAVGLGVLTTSALIALLVAPLTRSVVTLSAVLVITALLLMIAGVAGVIFLLPEPLGHATYTYQESGSGGQSVQAHWMIPTFPFTYLTLSAVLAWAGWRWAKSRGERWFRFEG